MSIQIQGYTSGVAADVGGTGFRALKVTCMPYEYGSLGSYKLMKATGTMAAGLAGAAPIMSFRWTDATRLAVVSRVALTGLGSLTGFTAGQALFELYVARSFTVIDTGGTTLTITGNNGKMRTSMGTTLLGNMLVSATATLTAGTRTLDSQPVGIYQHSLPTTANLNFVVGNQALFQAVDYNHPIVLAANEGLVVQATVPATGTWLSGVSVAWTEVASF